MLNFGAVRFFIFSAIIVGLLCSANDIKHLKARVKLLETRLNSEVYFRDEEYAEITERLDYIDKVLNVTEATATKKQSVVPGTKEVIEIDYESVNSLRRDFARIRTAFREEKTETERIRREIPKIKNNMASISYDVDNYCKSALNNTAQILTSYEDSSASEKQMMFDVKNKLELVTNNTEDIKLEQNQDYMMLKEIAGKVKVNTEQIESLKTLFTNMYTMNAWFGSSCHSLKLHGLIDDGKYYLNTHFEVYCDQATDEGGWTVFQRRLNGDVDFYRNWTEYKKGFGVLDGEFWLGNDHLSSLTAEGDHELRVEMEDFDGNVAYAKYSKFKVYPEENKYTLEVSGYSGTADDSLELHNGMMFSTFDRDNDKWSSVNCADKWHGAWWHNSCHTSNLNGRYYDEPGKIDTSGITWYYWKKSSYCLKKVEMKFR